MKSQESSTGKAPASGHARYKPPMDGLLPTRERALPVNRLKAGLVMLGCSALVLPLSGCLSAPKASNDPSRFGPGLGGELKSLVDSAGSSGTIIWIGIFLALCVVVGLVAYRKRQSQQETGSGTKASSRSGGSSQPDTFKQYLSIGALVLGAIAISFAAIFAEKAMYAGYMGSSSVGFWRFALAVPFFLVLMAILPKRTEEVPRAGSVNPLWLLLPGLLFAGDIGFWHAALPYTTAATATLLANIQVFIVGFFGWLLLKEKLRPVYVVGLVLAFMGIWLLLTRGHSIQENASNPLLGDTLSIITAFWYAGYLLMVKWLRRDYRTIEIMLTASIVAASVLFLAAMIRGEIFIPFYNDSMPDQYGQAWLYLVLLALVPQCIGQGLIAWSFFRLPASFSAVVLLLQPVCAAFLGWWMLSEVLSDWQLAACGLVLVGIVLARLGSRASD